MTFRDTANQFAALCALFGAYATVGPAYGSVVSGTISEWRESTFSNQIGDGQHNLSVFWSYNTIHRGFFYDKSVGSSNGGGSGAVSVAYVSGVTDISQISDASIFSPTSYSVGPLCDATCSRTGVGSFLVWKSEEGY